MDVPCLFNAWTGSNLLSACSLDRSPRTDVRIFFLPMILFETGRVLFGVSVFQGRPRSFFREREAWSGRPSATPTTSPRSVVAFLRLQAAMPPAANESDGGQKELSCSVAAFFVAAPLKKVFPKKGSLFFQVTEQLRKCRTREGSLKGTWHGGMLSFFWDYGSSIRIFGRLVDFCVNLDEPQEQTEVLPDRSTEGWIPLACAMPGCSSSSTCRYSSQAVKVENANCLRLSIWPGTIPSVRTFVGTLEPLRSERQGVIFSVPRLYTFWYDHFSGKQEAQTFSRLDRK